MTRHDDRAVRVLRALTAAWAAMLARQPDNASLALAPAVAELEADVTLARCHPDLVALLEDVLLALQAEAKDRHVAMPGSGLILERVRGVQARMWGGKA